MKKILSIGIIVILLIAGIGIYFLSRDESLSLGESVRDVLPFGQGGESLPFISQDENPPEELSPAEQGAEVPRMFRISEAPVAGAVIFKRGDSTVVRFADRATGHIYDVLPTTLERIKITNTTMPKIYEAYFAADGNHALIRSLVDDGDTVANTALHLIPPTGTSTNALYTSEATILRGDIDSIDGGTARLAYILKNNGSVVTSEFNGNNLRTLFTAPFSEWIIDWYTPDTLVLTTKADNNVLGYAYRLNTGTGALSKILGPLNALTTTTSPDGRYIAYSYDDNGMKLVAENTSEGIRSEIVPVTLPEKCVWSGKSSGTLFCGTPENGIGPNEPSFWYQGRSHYSDRIWKFEINRGIEEILVDPKKDFNIDIDVQNMMLSPDEDYLLFTNKRDLSLWALKLK